VFELRQGGAERFAQRGGGSRQHDRPARRARLDHGEPMLLRERLDLGDVVRGRAVARGELFPAQILALCGWLVFERAALGRISRSRSRAKAHRDFDPLVGRDSACGTRADDRSALAPRDRVAVAACHDSLRLAPGGARSLLPASSHTLTA